MKTKQLLDGAPHCRLPPGPTRTYTSHTMIPRRRTALRLTLPALILFVLLAPSVRPAGHPVRLGVNIAGSWHMMHTDKLFYEYESFFRAVDDLGAQFLDVVFLNKYPLAPTTMTQTQVLDQLRAIDGAIRAHGLQYTLNLEMANWTPTFELTPGVNELDHPDGTHRWDFPMAWLNQILTPIQPVPAVIGINFDESDHQQLTGHQYLFYDPPLSFDKPYYLVTDGMSLEAAYAALCTRVRSLRLNHYQGRLPTISEQVWPDMFHIFASQGWTLAPKVLMDSFAPVMMASAMGAALQYQDRGTDLWVLHELGKRPKYPGWSPAALRSSLLMSYWLGASAIYVENLDFSESTARHPLASPKGSLIWWDDPDHYQVSNHGAVVREFYKNYVPTHPRPFDWRDYRPRVAIVRLPDGSSGKPPAMRDRLLGERDKPTDDVAAQWFKVWRVLTHGTTLDGAITLAHWTVYPADISNVPFFVPVDSVAVFDHTVHGAVLDTVECFVVCGHALTAETFAEMKRRTAEGAVCIIARPLYAQYAAGPLPGNWLVVDDFGDPAVAAKLAPFLGPADVARFRFKDYTVELRPTTDGDTLEVIIQETRNAADRKYLTLR